MLEECGVNVLSNEYLILEQNGDRLALLGAEDPNGYANQKTVGQLADQVRSEQGPVYQLLLSHRNNKYEDYAAARVDLTLAGHAHGGLIRIPGTDGLIGPQRELMPHYTAGLYDLDYGQMVVSRGLADQRPAFRLLNRPDVPLVVLE
jgi:predicted MPP superfamily phosphohydrolase